LNDLTAESIRRALPGWVPEVQFLPETGSTNRVAMEWAAEGAAHGSLVVADYQTAGRGRLERTWLAPAGSSVLASVVLRPAMEAAQRGLLALAAAVALCRCLEELEVPASVKWPNDVLLGDRKVAGMLSEAAGDVVVLGVGVNVKQQEFPEEIAASATSLERFTGRGLDRLAVLEGLVRHLARLVDGPVEQIVPAYRPWCGTLGRRVRVDVGSGPIEDLAAGIDSSGALVLAGGRTILAGDLVQLR
jgi:BirA family transcriptional regulator, biotin operon repressor / biotin---[acetyl-CoA-carboxylase] ligase